MIVPVLRRQTQFPSWDNYSCLGGETVSSWGDLSVNTGLGQLVETFRYLSRGLEQTVKWLCYPYLEVFSLKEII
jgi:hypothetical protein